MKQRFIIRVALVFTLMLFIGQASVLANFKDVNGAHWANAAIQQAVKSGLVNGYPDGTFKPNQTVTTAEFVAILVRSYGNEQQIPMYGSFNENISNYMKQVSYPYSNQPSKKMTRAEVATLIAQSNGLSFTGDDAIKFLLVNDLAKGKVANGLATVENYKGNDLLTRAEAVTFVQNIQKHGLDGSKSSSNLAKFMTNLSDIHTEYNLITNNPGQNYSKFGNYVVFGDINELNQTEIDIFILTNEERLRNGRAPLALDVELSKVARLKSKDMHDNRYFSHDSPKYGSPFEMMSQFGISFGYAGENIAAGYQGAADVTNGWINSPGHHQNMINENFERIGIGFYDGHQEYVRYYTQLFKSD